MECLWEKKTREKMNCNFYAFMEMNETLRKIFDDERPCQTARFTNPKQIDYDGWRFVHCAVLSRDASEFDCLRFEWMCFDVQMWACLKESPSTNFDRFRWIVCPMNKTNTNENASQFLEISTDFFFLIRQATKNPKQFEHTLTHTKWSPLPLQKRKRKTESRLGI